MPAKQVELHRSPADGLWRFRVRNANGRITEPSQGYTLRRTARKAARRDVPGVPIVDQYDPWEAE